MKLIVYYVGHPFWFAFKLVNQLRWQNVLLLGKIADW